jgi:hypothetical protein
VVLPSSSGYGILKMSAVCSEMLATTYQITQCHELEDNNMKYWCVTAEVLHGIRMCCFYRCTGLPHGGYKFFHTASPCAFINSIIQWLYHFQLLFTLGCLLQLHYAVDAVSFS